jgi:2-polyprenyl-6-methoxyphenol hydroxylase-like FAD-dependent oxidoreductase
MMATTLVVGAGPVGLTIAAELARYGVSVRIVERAAARTDKSKALVLWSRSLELMDRMDIADTVVAAGMKVAAARIWAGGKQLAHVPFDVANTPYPYALMLP